MKNLIFLIAVILACCAFTYGPFNSKTESGYSSHRLSDSTFTVSFWGDKKTSMKTTIGFCFLRAAQIGKIIGCNFFTTTEPNLYERIVEIRNKNDTVKIVRPRCSFDVTYYHSKPITTSTIYHCDFVIKNINKNFK